MADQDRRDFQEQAHNLDPDTCKRMNEHAELLAQIEDQVING